MMVAWSATLLSKHSAVSPSPFMAMGPQTRSFCYVDDLVSGLVGLMENSKGEIGPMNLGNPGEFTMLELASLVLELTGSSSKLENTALPPMIRDNASPILLSPKATMGWEPKVALREGLGKTISYFEAHLKALG